MTSAATNWDDACRVLRTYARYLLLTGVLALAVGCKGSAIDTTALPTHGPQVELSGDVTSSNDTSGTCLVDSDCAPLATTACSQAICEALSHRCIVSLRPERAACDDGDACTAESVCEGGSCIQQSATDCDDGNPCTTDSCDVQSGCVHTIATGLPGAPTCSDGNPCTTGDHCDVGACVGNSNICGCKTDADCAGISQKDACVGTMQCNQGGCVVDPAQKKDCDDKNPCTVDTCEASGCTHKAAKEGQACNDGNICTVGETCTGGACKAASSITCGFGQACEAVCDPTTGCSGSGDVSTTCDDGIACSESDHCQDGACVGKPICNCLVDSDCPAPAACMGTASCVAGACTINPSKAVPCAETGLAACQENVCTSQGCVAKASPAGIPCSGSACTVGATCDGGGVCQGGSKNDCDDSNGCTIDLCQPGKGCGHTPAKDAAVCDDGNPCTTGELCKAGACLGGKATCSDGDPCTADLCDVGIQGLCLHDPVPEGGSCLGGDPCRSGGMCTSGKCVGGITQDCDDLSPCTVDLCLEATSAAGPTCQHLAVDATTACDDGNACTSGDTCVAGLCASGAQTCECQQDSDCAGKDDGNLCNGTMACVEHKCVISAGSAIVCPLPLSPCVTVTCAPNTGLCNESPVTLSPDGTPAGCEDGNPCTTGDLCNNGVCLAGAPTSCDDNQPCTNDVCDSTLGCTHLPYDVTAAIPCDDGNACTFGDLCGADGCTPGTNACQCQTDGDCAAIDDSDLCNGKLICQGNACVSDGNIVQCAATGSPCISSTCLPTSGTCVTAAITDGTICGDSAGCTSGGQCQGGTCIGAQAGCNDGNPCTVDSCDATGCVHLATPGTPCDDGEACTTGDACDAVGLCQGGTNTCSCQTDVDCPSDGNACNGVYGCESGFCKAKVGSVVVCDAAGNTSCAANTCDITTGLCGFVSLANGATCDDGDACTLSAACTEGTCTGGSAVNCADDNTCTADGCSPAQGCYHLNGNGPCDDGNPCTIGDQCQGGACVSGEGNCNCAIDSDCKDDGDLCNGIPTCVTGQCTVLAASIVACDPSANTACTVSVCTPAKGICEPTPVPDGTACNDASVCTSKDQCTSGSCGGTLTSCDDGNACSTDTCDPLTGCANTPNTLTCNDGNDCTTNDACAGGICTGGVNTCTACQSDIDCPDDGDLCNGTPSCQANVCKTKPGSAVICVANSACSTQQCQPATGQCLPTDVTNGTACDDASVCTGASSCFGGACVGSQLTNCDDKNPCTTDSCDSKAGCVHSNADGPCDDGNPCTAGDQCNAGACLAGPNQCACVGDKDCASKASGNLCDGTLICQANQCVIKVGTPVICDAGFDTKCAKNTCQPNSGLCALTSVTDGTQCDDGSLCTVGDLCTGGACFGQALQCDDKNVCTTDACDAKAGCTSTPTDGAICDDGNACTLGDACTGGQCVGSGTCQCQNTGDCAAFEDGNACNGTLICQASQCVVNPASIVNCPASGNGCTVNSCDAKSGQCIASSAQDGIPCGGATLCGGTGTCTAGTCKGTSGCADDGNPCTTASCDGNGNCAQTPNAASCSDGNTCTIGDTCAGGACVAGPSQCTCKTNADCTKLDDGNLCNGVWTCVLDATGGGQCAPDPNSVVTCPATNNTCETNICQPSSGKCAQTSLPNGQSCDDGNACTGAGQCFGGNCLAGVQNCDDANPCTTDSCDIKAGCLHANAGNFPPTTCDDGDPCTPISICQNGKCQGPFNNCFCQNDSQCQDDGNLCNGKPTCQGGSCKTSASTVITCDATKDTSCLKNTCQTASGICLLAPTAAGTACSDNNACTGGDVCSGGTCIGINADCNDNIACTNDACDTLKGCTHTANAAACDDGNPCTSDSCDLVGGCARAPILGNACNDGNPCTTGEVCELGAVGAECMGGKTLSCDDGLACTVDSCDAKIGCVHAAADAPPCDDGNVCTQGDACAFGKCVGAAKSCDDGNPCTQDACTPSTDCLYTPLVAPCEDGNACTVGDTCTGGKCAPGGVVDCADSNVCTTDTCDAVNGCLHTANADTCDDGLACTIGDTCAATQCAGTVACDDGNTCTADACGPGGVCVNTILLGNACSDASLCTSGDTCQADGTCAGISVVNCEDGNACTADSCIAVSGACDHTPTTGSCSDGNTCTNDSCSGGACVGIPAAGTPCDDGLPCTAGDVCDAGGKCLGTTKNCDDGSDCTIDACDAATGNCVYTPTPGFSANFDDGTFGGITTQSFNAQASWQVDKATSASAPAALYIGRILLGTYSYNVGPNAATATLPSIQVPKDIVSATLSLKVLYSRDAAEPAGCTGFSDQVGVLVGGQQQAQICESTVGFQTYTVDVTSSAGQALAVTLNFIANATANNGKGAWFDDVAVSWVCK